MKLIRVGRNELLLTVVMVTHDLESLLESSDRIAVLADQRPVAIGPAREVMEREHPFIRSFIFGARGARVMPALRSSLPVV